MLSDVVAAVKLEHDQGRGLLDRHDIPSSSTERPSPVTATDRSNAAHAGARCSARLALDPLVLAGGDDQLEHLADPLLRIAVAVGQVEVAALARRS